MGPSTILSILPLVLAFTQSLIVGTAPAAAKSSGATFASKNCFDSSRKLVSNGNPVAVPDRVGDADVHRPVQRAKHVDQ